MGSSILIKDFLYEVWIYQYPKIALAMFFAWIIYVFKRTPEIIDVTYTLSFLIVGTSLFVQISSPLYLKPLILFILLLIWTIRLAGYLFITRVMKNYVDPRYQIISSKANSRIAYFFLNYQGQAIITALITSVLYFVFRKPNYINPITFSIGIVLIIIGIIFESKCDYELYKFRQRKSEKKQIFQEGLWKNSRHPNLFFDLVTWFGFAFTGVNNEFIEILGFLGPFFLFWVMHYLTVPITEHYMFKTREGYKDIVKRTNKYWPF